MRAQSLEAAVECLELTGAPAKGRTKPPKLFLFITHTPRPPLVGSHRPMMSASAAYVPATTPNPPTTMMAQLTARSPSLMSSSNILR